MSRAPYRQHLPVVITLGLGVALSVLAGGALRSQEWQKLQSDFAAAGLTWLPYATLLGGVFCTALLARYLQRNVQRSHALAREVAERSEIEASRRLLNTAVECAANAVLITDFQGNIVWVNRAFTTLTGYAKDEVLGRMPRLLKSGVQDAAFYTDLLNTIHGKQIWHGQLVNRRKDGSLYTEEMTITPVLGEDGGIRNFVAIKQDVTEREAAQQKLTCVQAAVDDAGDAILMLDSRGAATYLNVAFTVLFRHTLESINEQGWESVFARPAIGAEILEASTYLDPWAGEAEMVARGGHAFPAEIRAAPIIGKGTLSAGTMLFICDITERKRAETALAESEERHRAITACARDAIVSADASGRILFWNSAAEQIFGYTAAEVVGRSLIDCIVPPQHHAATLAGLAGFAQTGPGAAVGKTLELTALRRDGTEFPIEAAVSSYRDQHGFVGVAVVRDITDRQHAEADRLLQLAVEKERDHLRDALLAQERVVGVVGHELRSPLAALRATAEFLLQDGAKELAEFDGFVKAINEEIVRMADLVNDLVEVARLNSGTARWNWSDFALAEVCEQALDSIRPLIHRQNVRLHHAVTPPTLRMRGDASAIRRLLVNLLSNAHKHTAQGEISVRITRTPRDAHDWVELCVRDTGTGIPPEVASRLGIAFALNSGVVGESHVKGSGLGLAICKGIAAAHAGRIRIETAPGKGTVITVTLRADLPEAETAADDETLSCGALS